MPDLYNMPVNASTRVCAVYGHPVRHSASPAMQNAGIAELGLNWRYLAFEVPPSELRAAILGAKAMRYIGLNLTVPHKLVALEMVDCVDSGARAFGAVNTICFEGREAGGDWKPLCEFAECPPELRSHGFNTDADAIVRTIREDAGVELRGARVLLLGAGGAGRAAALKLAQEGVQRLWLVNRSAEKAREVASTAKSMNKEMGVEIGYPDERVDLVVNATSLGLKDSDPMPLDTGLFPPERAGAVLDMIYRPAETPLLKCAKRAGCRVINGLGMLLYQGAKALELWTGLPAPEAVMRRALEQEVYG